MSTKNAALAVVIFLVATVASAHHSDAAFDHNRVVAFDGKVVRFQWRNPHVYIVIKDSIDVEWLVETGATPIMRRSGWNRDSFAIGDIVSVRLNPDRNQGKKHGLLLSIMGPDGVAMSSRQENFESDLPTTGASTTSLAGIWAGELAPRKAFLTSLRDHPLTPKGELAAAQYDNSMHSTVDCIAPPTPWIVAIADIHLGEIEFREDIIYIRSEFNDAERTVYTDGRGHPDNGERTDQGHSIGFWDGSTLVVDTKHFADNRSPFPFLGIPSGAQKHVVERYTLAEDGTRLLIDIFLEDPEYLAKPITTKLAWNYAPHLELLEFDCDPEVARRFLE
ncbi:exported protein of unknown function [uncultured Woeseiaceae bacterium]|uniref:Uncharacterized protein n=1 Tax=uncultured Woeseiaceae bacterium TaxID=1983305 RepID=A0A7D9H6E6_9GAMM|nr:exported protein of unknown function [uncultured Woeseiaceae bacterium]